MAQELTVAQNIQNNPRTPVPVWGGTPFDPNPSDSYSETFKPKEAPKQIDANQTAVNPTGTETTQMASLEKQYEQDIGEAKKSFKERLENPPKLGEMPKEPVRQDTDPWQTFGSPAMMLATFGSLFTRAPLTAALNAGAGVMKAQAAKDDEAYKQQMEQFKSNMERYWKLADYERDMYKTALQEDKGYADVLSTAFGHETENLLKQTQGKEQAAKLGETLDKKLLETKALEPYFNWQEKSKQDGSWTMEEDQKRFRDALVTKAMTEGKGMTGAGAAPTISSGAIDNFAKAIHDGVKPSALGLGYGNNANKAAVLNRVAELYPDFDMADAEADYVGRVAGARTLGTSGSKITLAANSLDQAIPLARDAMKGVDLTRFTSLNQFENYARSHSGDPGISALNTALQTVMSDYSSLIARNGQQTDSTRAAARDLVNQNMAKGQLNAVFDQMEKEKTAQLKAIKQTKKDISNQVTDTDGNGSSKDSPIPMPKDKHFEVGKYYDTPQGIGKYLGGGQFE